MKVVEHRRNINFEDLRLDKLMEYIIETHHAYIKKALSSFNVHSKTIVKVDSDVHPEVLSINKLLQQLKDLLEQHLIFEEFILFPYIKKLMESTVESTDTLLDNPIKKIRTEHLRISKLLTEMRILSNNYTPAVNSSPALKLCYAQLFDLEQDIHKHTFLEENILFSKLIELEKRKITMTE